MLNYNKKLKELKKYKNNLIDYYEILSYYPDYYKTKIELEKTEFPPYLEIQKIFDEEYKDTEFYKDLNYNSDLSSQVIYNYMKKNKDLKYSSLKKMFDALVSSSINLCDLIDYIGHYPIQEEKNSGMEELLNKYDIIIKYYLEDDIDGIKIISNDIVRIIEKLEENLGALSSIKDIINDKNWMFVKGMTDEEMSKEVENTIEIINNFPQSLGQEQNKDKKVLKLKYDNNNYINKEIS